MSGTTWNDQQRAVLEVASRLFAEHGLNDVTMADIAAEADVARATVFNYFGSKHALVEAMTERVIVTYEEMLDEALRDETTPTGELIRHLFENMSKGIESERRFFRGIFREIAAIQLGLDEGSVAQRANDEATRRLELLVARGQHRGELSDAYATEVLARALRSLANGTITDWLYSDTTEPLAERMRAAADVFLAPVEVTR